MFVVAKLLQIKDMSQYIHKRWLLGEFSNCPTHEFDKTWKRAIHITEKVREEKEQKEMEEKLSFEQTVSGSRKQKQECYSKEERKSEDEEDDENLEEDLEVLISDYSFKEEEEEEKEESAKKSQGQKL